MPTKKAPTKKVLSTSKSKKPSKKSSAAHPHQAAHAKLNKILTVIAAISVLALLLIVGFKWYETEYTVGPTTPVSPQQLIEEENQP